MLYMLRFSQTKYLFKKKIVSENFRRNWNHSNDKSDTISLNGHEISHKNNCLSFININSFVLNL